MKKELDLGIRARLTTNQHHLICEEPSVAMLVIDYPLNNSHACELIIEKCQFEALAGKVWASDYSH